MRTGGNNREVFDAVCTMNATTAVLSQMPQVPRVYELRDFMIVRGEYFVRWKSLPEPIQLQLLEDEVPTTKFKNSTPYVLLGYVVLAAQDYPECREEVAEKVARAILSPTDE